MDAWFCRQLLHCSVGKSVTLLLNSCLTRKDRSYLRGDVLPFRPRLPTWVSLRGVESSHCPCNALRTPNHKSGMKHVDSRFGSRMHAHSDGCVAVGLAVPLWRVVIRWKLRCNQVQILCSRITPPLALSIYIYIYINVYTALSLGFL
jgi:hypothetical protein